MLVRDGEELDRPPQAGPGRPEHPPAGRRAAEVDAAILELRPGRRRGAGADRGGRRRVTLTRRRPAVDGRAPARAVAFAHNSERQLAKLLDFYGIEWKYEPRTFVLETDAQGRTTKAFSPDFYLPAYDLYIEITTLSQKLVTKKNRKVRRLRELYPDVDPDPLPARLREPAREVRARGARRSIAGCGRPRAMSATEALGLAPPRPVGPAVAAPNCAALRSCALAARRRPPRPRRQDGALRGLGHAAAYPTARSPSTGPAATARWPSTSATSAPCGSRAPAPSTAAGRAAPTTSARSRPAGRSTPTCSTRPTRRCSTTSSCGGSTTSAST